MYITYIHMYIHVYIHVCIYTHIPHTNATWASFNMPHLYIYAINDLYV